jgi:hypothetical protein
MVESNGTNAGHLGSNINKNGGNSSVKVPVGSLEKLEPARRNNITSDCFKPESVDHRL